MNEELKQAINQEGVIRPSTIKRVMLCPYSYKMCKDWESTSDEASRGTRLHKAVWDDETLNGLEESDRLIVERIREDFVEKDKAAGYIVKHELHVQLKDGEDLLTEGTLDYLAMTTDGKYARIIDFKFGALPVDKGPFNEQLKTYAAALLQEIDTLEEVSYAILQPEISWDIYEDDLGLMKRDEVEERISVVRKITEEAFASTERKAQPGPEQCRFCNKMECKPWQQACLSAIVSVGREPDAGAILAHPGAFMDTKMGDREMMTYADDFLVKVALLEDAVKKAKERVSNWVLLKGGSPHFAVIEGRKTTKIDWKALVDDLGVEQELLEGLKQKYTTETTSKSYLRSRSIKKVKG